MGVCHLRWLLWKNFIIFRKHFFRVLFLYLVLIGLYIVNFANAYKWKNDSKSISPLYYSPQCGQTSKIMSDAVRAIRRKELRHTPFPSAGNISQYTCASVDVVLFVEFLPKRCNSNVTNFNTRFVTETLEKGLTKIVEKYNFKDDLSIRNVPKWLAKLISKDRDKSITFRWRMCANSIFLTWVAILLTMMSYFTSERKSRMMDSLKEIGVSYFVMKISWELIFFVQLLPFTALYTYLMIFSMPQLDILNTIFYVLFVAISILIWMNLPIWLVWENVRFGELLAIMLLFLQYCIAPHTDIKPLQYLSIAFLWNESFKDMVDFSEGNKKESIQYEIWYTKGLALLIMDIVIYAITLVDIEYIGLLKDKFHKNPRGSQKGLIFPDDIESEEFNLYPTVELVDVSKRYFPFFSFQKYVDAVNNITMTFYKNEIAVILGENGSGKTTLVSLITGVIKPSRGNCYLKFADTRCKKDMEYFRRQIGVCHQYNNIRNYNDLTVMQHMILFTCLRGFRKDFAMRDSIMLLNDFEVAHVANRYYNELSKDVVRRVNLALAFTGETTVVILDDPTYEIDPSARRSIWKTLINMKKERCIILCTRSVQEAEYCSDRLAILNNGTIRCHGTTDFIKKRFGIGNHLVVTQSGNYDQISLKNFLKEIFPQDEELFSENNYVVKYTLRNHKTEYNDYILELMENNASKFDIINCKIAMWSLEDIIMSLLRENSNIIENGYDGINWNLPIISNVSTVCTQYRAIIYKLFLVFKYTFFRIIFNFCLFTIVRFGLWRRKSVLESLEVRFDTVEKQKDVNFSIYLNVIYPLSMCFLMDFYIQEKTCGFKFLQYVSGVKFIIMWSSALGKDLLIILFSLSIMWLVTLIFPDLFMDPKDIGIFMMIFLVYSFALLSFFYVLLLQFQSTNTFTTIIILMFLIIGLFHVYVYERTLKIVNYNLILVVHYMLIILPPYAFMNMFYQLNKQYEIYELCYVISKNNNTSAEYNDASIFLNCKEMSKYPPERTWDTDIYISTAMLFIEGVIFWMLFYTIEELHGRLNRFSRFGLFVEPIKTFVHPTHYTANKNVQHYNIWNLNCSRPQIWTHPVFVRDVSKTFRHGKLQVLNHLFFSIREGECFGLIGRNGEGKSTAFKILVGELMLINGNAWVCGYNVKTQINKIHSKIGYCPQLDALYNLFTVYSILKFFCLIRGHRKYYKEIIEIISQQLDLKNELFKRIHTLNSGNKRKVSIAIAILGDPQVIILDEPTTGVGVVARRHIWHVLNSLRRKGKTLIVTTENMRDCEMLCTNVGILKHGSMAFIGSIRKLKRKYSGTFIVYLTIERYVVDIDNLLETIRTTVMKSFFEPNFSMKLLSRESRRYMKYRVRGDGLQWNIIHKYFRTHKKILHLRNFSVSEISLEEIYLEIVNS